MKPTLAQVEAATLVVVEKTGRQRVTSEQVRKELARQFRDGIAARSVTAHLRFLYDTYQGEFIVNIGNNPG